MRVCKKVDSSFETMDSKETSATPKRYPLFSKEATLCHAVQAPLAMTEWGWITKEAALRLLCHADKSARNDRETPKAQMICKKVDRIKTPAKDSRIFAMILGVVECKARAHTWGM